MKFILPVKNYLKKKIFRIGAADISMPYLTKTPGWSRTVMGPYGFLQKITLLKDQLCMFVMPAQLY
jgi:hypothetical protein